MANFTQEAIKQTFLQLLEKMPLNQITVKLLVEECGINRNTFYYHFQDLPDLIEEIIREEADRIISRYPSVESIEDAMYAALEFASKNRSAILHIYQSVNRDIFERYLWNVCDYVVASYGKHMLGDGSIREEDNEVLHRVYKCVCFGLVIDWLDQRMTMDVHEQIHRFCELHKGIVEEVIRRSRADEGAVS